MCTHIRIGFLTLLRQSFYISGAPGGSNLTDMSAIQVPTIIIINISWFGSIISMVIFIDRMHCTQSPFSWNTC